MGPLHATASRKRLPPIRCQWASTFKGTGPVRRSRACTGRVRAADATPFDQAHTLRSAPELQGQEMQAEPGAQYSQDEGEHDARPLAPLRLLAS